MSQQLTQPATIFDSLRRVRADGSEFWSARDLMALLGYSRWGNFQAALNRAMEACENSGQDSRNHFPASQQMVEIGSGAERSVLDYRLTRYAAYLAAMNSDPSKGQVAQAQTYFVAQTRAAEVAQAQALAEDEDPVLAQLNALARVRREQLALEKRTAAVEQATAQLERRLDSAPITSDKVGQIHRLGQQLGQVMGDYRRAWRMFKDRFGLASYRDLPNCQFDEGVHFLRLQIAAYTGQPSLMDGEA